MTIKQNIVGFATLGILVALLLGFIYWNGQLLPYLFYLRIPLISGALLFLLPVICIYLLPAMFGNMFVMSNIWRMALIIPGAVATGLGITLVGCIIGANAPMRFDLAPCPWLTALGSDGSWSPYLWAVFLSFPTALATYWSSGPASEEMRDAQRTLGALIGILLSALLLGAVYWMRSDLSVDAASRLLTALFSLLPEEARKGLLRPDGSLASGHLTATGFVVVAVILYVIGLVAYRPRVKRGWQLPALSYVLGLLLIYSFLLGLLTFVLDYYRVPVLVSFLAMSALAYRLWKVDHYYDIRPTGIDAPSANDFVSALQQRLANQEGKRTLVVVCASGGGIQAAGWTSMVLTGLQRLLKQDFTRAIGLISTVSGGSVGALHFLDRFGNDGAPDDAELDTIFAAATADSLGATGWGLVYPDLWKFAGLPFLHTTPRDRGAAIDTDWRSFMKHPTATLRGWVEPIKNGKLPIPVFNATLVEDGRHYLISPMTFRTAPLEGVEFNGLYPDKDMDASTAALLSATFPYVTPIARNRTVPQTQTEECPVFHVADGGYFDNYGVISAVDWLSKQVLPNRQSLELQRILFVEIQAFPDSMPLETTPKRYVGWLMALFGPLLTVFAARNSTQAQRNQDEVNDIEHRCNDVGVKFFDFKISFPEKVKFFERPRETGYEQIDRYMSKLVNTEQEAKRYEPPLSWTLTKKQREAIREAWNDLAADSTSEVAKLKAVWKAELPQGEMTG